MDATSPHELRNSQSISYAVCTFPPSFAYQNFSRNSSENASLQTATLKVCSHNGFLLSAFLHCQLEVLQQTHTV